MIQDRLPAIFAEHTTPGSDDVVALVDALLTFAVERGDLEIRWTESRNQILVTSCGETCKVEAPTGCLRAVIARVAWLAAREDSNEFQPYGGDVVFACDTDIGPRQLHARFENTRASHWLRVCVA